MPFTVRFDPTSASQQASVIPDATPFNDGVMTKTQVAKLASLPQGPIPIATPTNDGLMSAAQASKLESIPAGDGGRQNFEYTIVAGDGSDFFVPLPTARADALYTVMWNQTKGTVIVLIECPNDDPADRTGAQFRVITSAALAVGDKIEFNVASKT